MTTVFEEGRAKVRKLQKARLLVTDGPDQGQVLQIDKQQVVVGRSQLADLALSDKAVSSQHFAIFANDEGYRLKDMGSRNGMYVGDVRVFEAALHRGMEFRLGRTVIRFEPTYETIDISLSAADSFGDALGLSVEMRQVFAKLERIATSDIACMITGDTGTGKEEIAKGIHLNSPRATERFVVVDCGSIPTELMESTLFGHIKGAFTGANENKLGLFEHGSGGTVFLDEVGELPLAMQPKLLRVLETRTVTPVGADTPRPIDVRIVSATNRNIRNEVVEGNFREDLFFRLAGIEVELPPLRERKEDVGLLAHSFLTRVAKQQGKDMQLGQDALAALRSYSWPGNVRELRNVIERAAFLTDAQVITRADLTFGDGRMTHGKAHELHQTSKAASGAASIDIDEPFKSSKQVVVDEFEVAYLSKLLEHNNDNISRSAKQAGLTRYHLRELLKRHGIAPKR